MAFISENKQFAVSDAGADCQMIIDALYGTTQNSSFLNINGELTLMNNVNNNGLLGRGDKLKGNTITINSNLENHSPNVHGDEDHRITAEFYISDPSGRTLVYRYDKPEQDDAYPSIELNIEFV